MLAMNPRGRVPVLKDGDYVGHASAMIETAKRRVQLVVYGMNADTRYSDSDVVALIGKLGAARARGRWRRRAMRARPAARGRCAA